MSQSRGHARRDCFLGLGVLALGLGYFLAIPWQVSALADGADNISGRTLPYLIAGVISLLGVALVLQAYRRLWALPRPADADRKEGAEQGTGMFSRTMLIYCAVIGLYALGMEYVGYMVSTAAVLLFAMWLHGARGKLLMAVMAAVTPPIIYLIFRYGVQVPFPDALLF
ncbi:MAG: tripartite tricarboxylate transporter TctB family protein [Desulfovibrionaceae bacterium]|nr:tripartite tricarboxylate transporter TctB family protein [Desulfovibrionaceae bacterium]